jgi:hypothetical protein
VPAQPVVTVAVQTPAAATGDAAAAPSDPQAVTVEVQAPVVVSSDESGETGTADPLAGLYERLVSMPDSPERTLIMQTLQELAEETQKEEAKTEKVQDMVKTVVKILPDVAEVTINTIVNPASGLLTLVQKVAKHVGESKKETKQAEQADAESPPGEEEPLEVDAKKAVEALGEVQEKLQEMADSPEKQLVEQALEQLEDTAESEQGAGKVAKLIENVAETLPDATEAVIETAGQVAESVAGDDKEGDAQ